MITVAAKISASYRARDGFSTDRLLNREQDDHNSFNIRGQLLFQPSDVFDALLTFDYSTDSNNGRSLSTIAPAGANDGDRRTSESGVPQEFERDTYGLAAHLNYHADHGTFTSISAFRESDSSDFFSFSSTNFSLLPSFNPFFPFQQLALNEDNPKTFSQELRYVSDFNGPVSLVAGLYYFYEDILRNANSTRFAGQSGNTLRDRTFVQDIQTNSFAAYTDIEIELSETVSLNVGGRYTWEEKEGQVALVDDLNPANNFSTPPFSDSFSDFSPRFVLNWKPTEDLLVYGSFTQGFTSGGFNTEEDTIAVVTNPFDPETVDAYEIGLKTELFDRRVRANITAFRQEFNNKQEGFLDPTFNFVILNASEATIEGFEVELNWSVNEYLNLFGSYAYLDARFTDFTIPGNTPQDRSGNRLATSPENSFSFGGDASIPVGDSGSLFVKLSFQIVCVDGMIGRNSAPQEGQMDGKRFQDWLASIDSLSETQRTEALAVLSGQADDVLSLAAVEAKVEEDRHCPHCGTPGAISRGRARGLRRYQCKGCGRTFNAATGTPLSGLHHKERWLTFGASLAEGETVRESASRCGLGVNTAFRWRHRFLAAVGQAPQKLKGIVEVDETYVLESNKGSRTLDRKARRRGGKASKRGLSHEQVPVLVAADRSGTTVSEVLSAVNADTLKAVLEPTVDTDIVLVSDSKSSYRPCAAAMGVRHEALKLSAGERVRDAFHIQTVNSRHSQLKDFLRGYRGIATKYLDRYLNWFHLIGMAEKASPRACLAAAISGPRIQFGN